METCYKCGYEHYDFMHCLKTFWYKHDDFDAEWQEIGAFDFEEAAEKIGEIANKDD